MTEGFVKPRYVQLVRSTRGRVYSYFVRHKGNSKRTQPIKGTLGSPAWWRHYNRLAGQVAA